MRPVIAACLVAALAGGVPTTPASAQSGNQSANPAGNWTAAYLGVCRMAAQKLGGDPTDFDCNWPAVTRGAPGGALTGKYDARSPRGLSGTLTILEGGGGPALIALQTASRASKHTCSVQVEGQRNANDVLVGRSAQAPGCSVRIVSSGLNLVRVTARNCTYFCGARATFEGTYRLRTR